MNLTTTKLLNLYRFGAPRRVFCFGVMLERLPEGAFAELRERIERAMEADRATCELEAHWRGTRGHTEYAPGATELDAELDNAIKALDDALAVSLKAFGEGSPRAEAATFARGRLFPKGVRAVTRQTFVKQAVMVSVLLERVEAEPELAATLDRLGARVYLERVAELNARYRELLQLDDQTQPSYDELRQARAEGQEAFCRIVFQVVARLTDDDLSDEEAAALEKALQVVLEQNAKIRRQRRRRRKPLEVDPETGEELEVEGAEDFESEEDFDHEDSAADPDDAEDALQPDAPPATDADAA